MICKNCQAQLPEGAKFCHLCATPCEPDDSALGTPQEQPIEPQEQPTEPQEQPSAQPEEEGTKKLGRMRRVAAISGCVAGLALLATVLFLGIRGNWAIFDFLKPRENDVGYKDSYSVSDSKAQSKGDVVVAVMGDEQLTNRTLQLYYWMQVYDFLDYYGSYAAYFGLDTSKPLDEQELEEGMTWQQYFLQTAIENWQTYTALRLEAEKNDYAMDESYREVLEKLEEEMQASATKAGFDTVDAMIADEMGAGTGFTEYYGYLNTYYTGYSWFNHRYSEFTPTEAEIEAYFTENEESLAASSVTKDSGKYVDVRHILIKVAEAEDTDAQADEEESEDDGNYGYSQAAWDTCLEKAQKILDTWLAGDRTEESFAELAGEHSEDPGSKDNGGLYTDVEEGQMLETFNDWCFDDVRVVGDYGLVKTKHGYHIMYFSGSEDIWHAKVKSEILSKRSQELVDSVVKEHPIEVEYKKIALAVVDMT